MVVIYGNIFYFADNLQIVYEGKLSKCWTVLQHTKYWWKLNIPFEYSDVQLTRDEGHCVDDVSKSAKPNCQSSSSYKVNSEVYRAE